MRFREANRVRRRALGDLRRRRQFTVFEDADDLIVILKLADVEGLHIAGAPNLLYREVLDIGDVEGLRLSDHALRGGVGVEGRHLQSEAQVLLHLLGDFIDVRHACAELPQGNVFNFVGFDGGEARHHARTEGQTAGRGRALHKFPPSDAHLRGRFARAFFLHLQTPLIFTMVKNTLSRLLFWLNRVDASLLPYRPQGVAVGPRVCKEIRFLAKRDKLLAVG